MLLLDAILGAANYRMQSRWVVPADRDAIRAIVANPTSICRWWPEAFLDATPEMPRAHADLGSWIRLHTTGRLPYTMRFDARITLADENAGRMIVETRGDFDGRAHIVARSIDEGRQCQIDIDWNVHVAKPMLAFGSLLFRPLMIMNHRWVMKRGESGLCAAIARTRLSSVAEARETRSDSHPAFAKQSPTASLRSAA